MFCFKSCLSLFLDAHPGAQDDMVLARGAASALRARLAHADAPGAASLFFNTTGLGPPGGATGAENGGAPGGNSTWLGLSLWSADDRPDGHACDNCYSKALLFRKGDAEAVADHVWHNYPVRERGPEHPPNNREYPVSIRRISPRTSAQDEPVDWLIADVEKREGRRVRALVPNLAEHIGWVPGRGRLG